jgi:cytochrome d ubiquinol oxidase subunit II
MAMPSAAVSLIALGPFPSLCAGSVLAGYLVLGGAWLYLKTSEQTRLFAEGALRLILPAFLTIFGMACISAASVQPEVRTAWKIHTASLTAIIGMMVFAAIILLTGIGKRSDFRPLIAALSMVGLGIVGLVLLVFPNVVPFRLSIWEASASSLSRVFLLIGALVVMPVVLTYSAFAYWVIRGKTPAKSWEL